MRGLAAEEAEGICGVNWPDSEMRIDRKVSDWRIVSPFLNLVLQSNAISTCCCLAASS